MADEIVNRVAQSKLITFDLEELYSKGERMEVDIAAWLYEGLLLREKEFRVAVDSCNWETYADSYVALFCSTEAIVPAWAFMLVATNLAPYAKKVVQGSLEDLETLLYKERIEALDVSIYKDRYVIIKGCSGKPVPPNAYIWASTKLQPIVKSLMYGEACSSVPLFKRK